MSLSAVRYLAAVSLLFAAQLSAQPGSWGSVRSIPTGGDVRIAIAGRPAIRGSLQSVTDDVIVLNAGSAQQTVARQDVTRVAVRKPGHRKRNALIGLAAGAGVGLGVGLASRCTGFCIVSTGEISTVTTVGGALAGTIVGALIPTGGWREVYKR